MVDIVWFLCELKKLSLKEHVDLFFALTVHLACVFFIFININILASGFA
jgi:hypothetical protein